MKKTTTCVLLAALAAGLVSFGIAQDSTTNKPPQQAFRTPLVRDLDLLDQVKGLTARVADLEAKNADLAKKLSALEAKVAALASRK